MPYMLGALFAADCFGIHQHWLSSWSQLCIWKSCFVMSCDWGTSRCLFLRFFIAVTCIGFCVCINTAFTLWSQVLCCSPSVLSVHFSVTKFVTGVCHVLVHCLLQIVHTYTETKCCKWKSHELIDRNLITNFPLINAAVTCNAIYCTAQLSFFRCVFTSFLEACIKLLILNFLRHFNIMIKWFWYGVAQNLV